MFRRAVADASGAPPSPALPPQTPRGKGASPVRHQHPARTPQPVIQRPRRTALARSTSRAGRRILHGARNSPGAAAGTEAEASVRARRCGVRGGIAGEHGCGWAGPAWSPGWPLPRPLPARCACGEGRIRSRFDRFVRVMLKPRTGRASGLCRGLPPFQPRVHPPWRGARRGCRALRWMCGGSLGRCHRCRMGRFGMAAPSG